MKKLLLFLFAGLAATGYSQMSCNQSTFNPTMTYSSSTTSAVGNVATAMIYVCPNANVYDTSSLQTCRWVIVNTGSYYRLLQKPCGMNYIYAKGNSTVNIAASSSGSTVNIVMEPTATIINSSTLSVNTMTCSAILTPSIINCTASGINESMAGNDKIQIYPNPSNEHINIKVFNEHNFSGAEISILNLLGVNALTVKPSTTAVTEIDVRDLQSGIYYLCIKSAEINYTRKIIIAH